MPKHSKAKRKIHRPIVIGTGLLALDAVISRESSTVRYWAGGTCGNVLVVLSFLGWNSKPVARLGTEKATELLLDDLRRWGVSGQFIRQEASSSTPIVVERITKDSSGRPRHSFSWRCAECGARFPGYKPELRTVATRISTKLRKPMVFFFDRLSAGALTLAQSCAEAGALIVFEPTSVGNLVLFRQACELAHVVKYSHERLSDLPEIDVANGPRLLIETLGDAGLRYRLNAGRKGAGQWLEREAFPVEQLRDSAGAGDWCTAGILSKIGTMGFSGFNRLSAEKIEESIRYGQALAAWNCQFEGARGGMYASTKADFRKRVQEIHTGSLHSSVRHSRVIPMLQGDSGSLCRMCEPDTMLLESKSTRVAN